MARKDPLTTPEEGITRPFLISSMTPRRLLNRSPAGLFMMMAGKPCRGSPKRPIRKP